MRDQVHTLTDTRQILHLRLWDQWIWRQRSPGVWCRVVWYDFCGIIALLLWDRYPTYVQ